MISAQSKIYPMITANVVKHSISYAPAILLTLEVVMPRIILAEFNTHRDFSRNSRSSRAVPFAKILAEVRTNPYVPAVFTSNQKGMQGGPPLTGDAHDEARAKWVAACESACREAEILHSLGVHKQHVNRLLEPFMWHKVLVSSTAWTNFYAQRRHEDAQPEIHEVADIMYLAASQSQPTEVDLESWHLPYVTDAELDQYGEDVCIKLSVARCARVSYYDFDQLGKTLLSNLDSDLKLYQKLREGMHWSPFEHQATPMWEHTRRSGNFTGWLQNRKLFLGENR